MPTDKERLDWLEAMGCWHSIEWWGQPGETVYLRCGNLRLPAPYCGSGLREALDQAIAKTPHSGGTTK